MALGGLLLEDLLFLIYHVSFCLKLLLDRKYKNKIIVLNLFLVLHQHCSICSKEWTYSSLFYVFVPKYRSFKKLVCVHVFNSHVGNPVSSVLGLSWHSLNICQPAEQHLLPGRHQLACSLNQVLFSRAVLPPGTCLSSDLLCITP